MDNIEIQENGKVFARNLQKPALLSTLVYLYELAKNKSVEEVSNLEIAIAKLKEIQKSQHQVINLDYSQQLKLLIQEAIYNININNSLNEEERLEYLDVLDKLKNNSFSD